jgi:hypothetical protein
MTAWIVVGALLALAAFAFAWVMNADDAGHGEGE